MKRYALFVLIISTILIITTFPARAGKPKPPDPYPQPAEMQAEAYPAPGQGAPGPGEPAEWCDGIYDFFCAYYNGIYVAWLNHLGYNPDLQIILCTAQVGTWWSYCREMEYLRYDAYKDRNVYTAGQGPHECFNFGYEYDEGNWFYIVYVYAPEIPYVGAQYATLWTPNLYPIFCVYLPFQKVQW
jgi:hypothetical protein